MSYIVELTNGKEIIIKDEVALKLSQSIYDNPKGMVTLNKELVKKSIIVNIYRGGNSEADRIPEEFRLSPVDNRGNQSPAKESIRKYLETHGTLKGYKAN